MSHLQERQFPTGPFPSYRIRWKAKRNEVAEIWQLVQWRSWITKNRMSSNKFHCVKERGVLSILFSLLQIQFIECRRLTLYPRHETRYRFITNSTCSFHAWWIQSHLEKGNKGKIKTATCASVMMRISTSTTDLDPAFRCTRNILQEKRMSSHTNRRIVGLGISGVLDWQNLLKKLAEGDRAFYWP